jgi:hypothetical protein
MGDAPPPKKRIGGLIPPHTHIPYRHMLTERAFSSVSFYRTNSMINKQPGNWAPPQLVRGRAVPYTVSTWILKAP